MLIKAAQEFGVGVIMPSLSSVELQGHFNAATALSIASDGWTLLSAGRDNVAILWDLRSYKKITTIPVFEAIEGMGLTHEIGPLDAGFPTRATTMPS